MSSSCCCLSAPRPLRLSYHTHPSHVHALQVDVVKDYVLSIQTAVEENVAELQGGGQCSLPDCACPTCSSTGFTWGAGADEFDVDFSKSISKSCGTCEGEVTPLSSCIGTREPLSLTLPPSFSPNAALSDTAYHYQPRFQSRPWRTSMPRSRRRSTRTLMVPALDTCTAPRK